MPQSYKEHVAAGFRQIAEEFDQARATAEGRNVLLTEIKDLLVTLRGEMDEHRDHVRDNVDRQGTRIFALERRLGDLEHEAEAHSGNGKA